MDLQKAIEQLKIKLESVIEAIKCLEELEGRQKSKERRTNAKRRGRLRG